MGSTFTPKIILIALISISLVWFAAQLGRVMRRIGTARPEHTPKRGAFALRCWKFFWEVICQAKVIQRRPLAGFAHALLLWGFLATVLAELDHFTSIFGVSLIDQNSASGVFYFWLFFLFALCLTLALAVLILRRYVGKAAALEELTTEAGLTLALLFVSMLTLLPLWWVSQETIGGQVTWWVHTVAVLVLVPMLARGRNLHIVLSPVSLFLKRPGFSEIPALEDEHDHGINNGTGIGRLAALQAYACMECGICTEQCPAQQIGQELDPRLIPLALRYYLDEYGASSDTPILENAIPTKLLFECTTCGACETACPVGVQHLPMIIGLRRAAVQERTWQDPKGAQLFQSLLEHGNAMGVPEAERDRYVAWQQLPIFDGSQEYCLWLGCMGAYDPRGRAIVEAFVDVMNHLGTSFGVLSKEYCTGDPARRLGNDAITKELADINLKLLRHYGALKIVSVCPHCVRTIAEDWNQLRPAEPGDERKPLDATIEHHTEFLARHADRLPAFDNGPKFAFHDPCYLGRYRDIYRDPRYVLERSGTVVEPKLTREKATCCGAGGGLVFLGEDAATERMGQQRAKELLDTGADVIATACPFCTASLRGGRAPKASEAPFLDIAQIVAEQIRA